MSVFLFSNKEVFVKHLSQYLAKSHHVIAPSLLLPSMLALYPDVECSFLSSHHFSQIHTSETGRDHLCRSCRGAA